jgi:rfaE bifunctional protein nucleotidyltransferase chain/domain
VGRVVDLEQLLAELAARPGRVVTTNGCFDVLHVGHLQLLREAKALGDILVVAVNDDGSVCRLKGPSRPLVPAAERAELLAALEPVDYVVLFSEDTPDRVLAAIRPAVHVKGGDYRAEDLPETPTVEAGGGRVVIVPLVAGRSTTDLIRRAGGE